MNKRKFAKLNVEKQSFVGNPEKFIEKLSVYKLSSKEIEILKVDLRNGVATRPVKSEMIVILEDI